MRVLTFALLFLLVSQQVAVAETRVCHNPGFHTEQHMLRNGTMGTFHGVPNCWGMSQDMLFKTALNCPGLEFRIDEKPPSRKAMRKIKKTLRPGDWGVHVLCMAWERR